MTNYRVGNMDILHTYMHYVIGFKPNRLQDNILAQKYVALKIEEHLKCLVYMVFEIFIKFSHELQEFAHSPLHKIR